VPMSVCVAECIYEMEVKSDLCKSGPPSNSNFQHQICHQYHCKQTSCAATLFTWQYWLWL